MTSFWQRLFDETPPATVKNKPVRPASSSAATAAAAVVPEISLAEISESFHRLVFALPAAEAGAETATGLALLKRLELLGTRFDIRSLPRLPTVLPQLLRSLKSETAAGRELAILVGRDPSMVGEVMRVTGSVYYRSVQPITSLQQAVILLGQDGLRRVLTQHAMRPILQANAGALGHAGEYLWDHAERCAHACAWLGNKHGGDAFEAYLAGIICHTGTGAVVRLLEQLLADMPTPRVDSDFVAQCAALGARLSLQAARYWELPARVIVALEENQASEQRPSSPLGEALAVSNLLAMADTLGTHDLLAADVDLSASFPDSVAPATVSRCQADLRRRFHAPEDAAANGSAAAGR